MEVIVAWRRALFITTFWKLGRYPGSLASGRLAKIMLVTNELTDGWMEFGEAEGNQMRPREWQNLWDRDCCSLHTLSEIMQVQVPQVFGDGRQSLQPPSHWPAASYMFIFVPCPLSNLPHLSSICLCLVLYNWQETVANKFDPWKHSNKLSISSMEDSSKNLESNNQVAHVSAIAKITFCSSFYSDFDSHSDSDSDSDSYDTRISILLDGPQVSIITQHDLLAPLPHWCCRYWRWYYLIYDSCQLTDS